jgi:hypothetical protein
MHHQELRCAFPSVITLSSQTLRELSRIIRAHRRAIGSRWRRLSPQRQALLVLAHLRNGDTYQRLAGGFGIGVATVCRYLHETIDLLARHAPTLATAPPATGPDPAQLRHPRRLRASGQVRRDEHGGDGDCQRGEKPPQEPPPASSDGLGHGCSGHE